MDILVFCDEEMSVAGGGSRQVVEFVRALVARGHHVRLVAPKPASPWWAHEALRRADLVWVWVPRLPLLRPLVYLIGSAFALAMAMRRSRPDVMLWFDSPGQVAPLLCARMVRCPYVLFVNGLPDEELTGWWRWAPIRGLIRAALRLAVQRAEAVVSVCKEIPLWMQQSWNLPPDRCYVIKNGVDTKQFVPCDKQEARRSLGLDEQGLYIGFVGGFFPWHSLDTVIEAMVSVQNRFPGVKLLLVGDGQQRAAIEILVQKRGLADCVSFVGRVGFDQIPLWIGASDVCVVLHRPVRFYPGDSMKLLEYLACARPVVASAGEGYGEFVESCRAGLSVTIDSPEDVAQGLIRLLSDPALSTRLGQAGRAAVVQSHTWASRAAMMEQALGLPPEPRLRERACA